MKIPCSSRHQSYASFRLEIFQSLFSQPSARCQPPPNTPRHGRVLRRRFGGSSKLGKQRGSRNIEQDAKLRAFIEERLVSKGLATKSEVNTPATSDEAPASKSKSDGAKEHSWGNPYRKEVQENLKGLLQDLRSAASTAQAFEKDFQTTTPTGVKVIEIMPDDSPLLHGKDFRHVRLDPEKGTRRLSLDLPESPVMRRLRKERKHKRDPTAEELSALLNNPWASILASPVRQCQGTGVRMPSDLLVPWSFVRKPSNNLTYLLPAGLADMKSLTPKIEPESQPPERSEDTDGAPERTSNAAPPSKMIGKTILTPYRPLMQRLTEKCVRRDSQSTRKGAVANILNNRVRVAFDEAQHYAEDFEEKSRLDLVSLKWDPQITTRMLSIMRERVLTALESLGVTNDSAETILPVPIKALETGRIVVLVGPNKDETTFRVADAMPEPSSRGPSRVFAQLIQGRYAGSFLLHINSAAVEIPDQPAAVLSKLAPNLLPQTISMNNTIRLPVFNLQQMMGFREWDGVAARKTKARYKEVLRSAKVLDLPRARGKWGDDLVHEGDEKNRPGYLLFVDRRANMAGGLAREMWGLWRYQGGWGRREEEKEREGRSAKDVMPGSAGEGTGEGRRGVVRIRARSEQQIGVWREELDGARVSVSA